MIYQSRREAKGTIRNILKGVIATPFVIATFYALFMMAYAFGG